MIDEKKIEEAAELYRQDVMRKGAKAGYVTIGRKRAFKAGINWFLDNLWHDASEEPDSAVDILIESCSQKGKSTFVRIIPFDWKFSVKNYNITRWLYIEDLMKGGK